MARLFVKLSTAALAAPVWLSGRGDIVFQQTGRECVNCSFMCGFGGRCCLRHAWEAFKHVSNYIDDHTSVLFHPSSVDCAERTAARSHGEL